VAIEFEVAAEVEVEAEVESQVGDREPFSATQDGTNHSFTKASDEDMVTTTFLVLLNETITLTRKRVADADRGLCTHMSQNVTQLQVIRFNVSQGLY